MKVWLRVVEGPDRGREFAFETRDRFLIGRVPTAHFQITQDPFFKNGDYSERPSAGVQLFGSIWAGWLYSQEWWRQQLWKRGDADTTSLGPRAPSPSSV